MPRYRWLYYITDGTAFPGSAAARRQRLLEKIGEAARWGVDYIQLRERHMPSGELADLAQAAVETVRNNSPSENGARTRLLINSRADIALAAGAAGVHLRGFDISPRDVRAIWRTAKAPGDTEDRAPVIGVSCHSASDVEQGEKNGADFAVFAPVFEKKYAHGVRAAGLVELRQACLFQIPVLALGGITLENADSCFEAGAAGIGAVRLFQEHDIADVVQRLR